MKINQHQTITSRTDFFYYTFRNMLLVGLPILLVFALALSLPHSSANGVDTLTLTLSSSCTMSSVVNIEHNGSLTSGTYIENIGKTTITTLCNDGNGYSIYANGYSNNEEGDNKLVNSEYPQYSIDTGLVTSGLTSTWAMKLNNIENDPSPTPPVIEQDYNNTYSIVPNTWTKVAGRASGTTDMDEGSSFTTTYAVYASSNQHAGTYIGQVKYALLHPSTGPYYPFMQDVANWSNTRLPNIGDSIQAIDNRDGKKYWVARLADGHIWMTQNLAIDLSYIDGAGNTVMRTFTSEDTDLTDHSLTGAYSGTNGYSYDSTTGITTWTPAITAKTINFEGTNLAGWKISNMEPYSANKTNDTNTGHSSIGNYYNWTAAIASNNSSSLTNSTYNDISQNPQNSICPRGWRLPTVSNESASIISSTNEFARLNYLYNNNLTNADDGLVSSPLYLTKGGYIYNSLELTGEGRLWSSTVSSSDLAYHLRFTSTQVEYARTGSGSVRGCGVEIRCVAR